MLNPQKSTAKSNLNIAKQRSYNEVVEYLDAHWSVNHPVSTLDRMKKLDTALGSLAQNLPTIMVAATNGKTLTINFTAKLLNAEGLKVGSFVSPHILTYNERFVVNNEAISNKVFTEIANDVINTGESLNLECNSAELLAMMAIVYFSTQKVDVALLEVSKGGKFNPVNICNAKVVAITRVTQDDVNKTDAQLLEDIKEIAGIIKPGTWVVSGDQNKSHLQLMQELTIAQKGNWAMPIRKLASMSYLNEQLFGRCGAIAERLASLFIEKCLGSSSVIVGDSLLTKQRPKRGRPTLDEKRKQAENPKKTLDQFWKETSCDAPAKFELLDKEKPSILLDTASNVDAFKNLLLGIRLLHYQRPLKGLTIIVSAAQNSMHNEEFLKLTRYFFKKTSGQILICPLENNLKGCSEDASWDVEKVTNDIKSLKVKARACKNFEEAFDIAKKSVDERNGLVVISGSKSAVATYWHAKGIKKL